MWQDSYWKDRAKIIESRSKLENMATRDPRHEMICMLVENWERINLIGYKYSVKTIHWDCGFYK